MNNLAFGKKGEEKASEFLQKNGYKILERNFKTKFGEIDIITKHKGEIVFVEVKTRSSDNFGLPEESVRKKKLSHLKRCATYYILKNRIDLPCRFEILSILWKENISFNIIPIE